jgi:hypothetical protein
MAAGRPVSMTNAFPNTSSTQAGPIKKGVAVADAAGANPTKAEFDALLASLRTAGVIAT